MRAWTVALLLTLCWACAQQEQDRVELCLALLRDSLVCVEKMTLQEARADDPNNVFLQRQTEEEWERFSMCKTRARDRWSEREMRELDACRMLLEDYYEQKREAAGKRS